MEKPNIFKSNLYFGFNQRDSKAEKVSLEADSISSLCDAVRPLMVAKSEEGFLHSTIRMVCVRSLKHQSKHIVEFRLSMTIDGKPNVYVFRDNSNGFRAEPARRSSSIGELLRQAHDIPEFNTVVVREAMSRDMRSVISRVLSDKELDEDQAWSMIIEQAKAESI